MPEAIVTTLECSKCGHKWVARVARPVRCPACLSPSWNAGSWEPEPENEPWIPEEEAESIADRIARLKAQLRE